jgi:hypothetical protein
MMEKHHYPNAGDILSQVEMMIQEQQQAAMMPQMGVPNEMPAMPGGIENYPVG